MTTVKVITFALLISVSNQQKMPTEEKQPCGQYGFRCVDMESFQICTYPDLDGITDAPEVVHRCFDGNVCDEDNPAYCTPLDPIEPEIKEKSSGKCQQKVSAKREQPDKFSLRTTLEGNSFDKNKRQQTLRDSRFNNKLKTRDIFDFNNEDETEPTTTTESDDYPSVSYQKFECEHFGYFPDVDNASMFWHCDHQNKGKGYIVRHMLCSKGRVFNPAHKECVMIGTTRNTRNEVGRDYLTLLQHQKNVKKNQKTDKSLAAEFPHYKFSCRNHRPGKYPDEINCRIYHYCLPRRFAPFKEITFLCPDNLTYDDEEETCNAISFHRCTENLHPHQIKELHIEIDAIVLQKRKCKFDPRRDEPADCSEYHLCYNDDEVHLKCPDLYRFNENLLTCQPQHLVSCEYET